LYDLDEVPRFSLSPGLPSSSATVGQTTETQLREAVSKALNPPTQNSPTQNPPTQNPFSWDDITFQHSDDENNNSDTEEEPTEKPAPIQSNRLSSDNNNSNAEEEPTEKPAPTQSSILSSPGSFSASPSPPSSPFVRRLGKSQIAKLSNPLDPGIERRIHTKPPNETRSGITRIAYRFDPAVPRPPHAKTPTFGHLPGLYIGKKWHSRIGAAWDGTHLPRMAGISGKEGVGVWSIALSGGYEDDFDEGYRFVYTGSGGRSSISSKVSSLSFSPFCGAG